MAYFIVIGIGLVVAVLLRREFGGSMVTAYSPTMLAIRPADKLPDGWMTNPAYWWVAGNIYHDDQPASSSRFDDDWITDPSHFYMPGNICYDDSSHHSSSSCNGSDWVTDPCCSYMPGNAFHDDHYGSSCDTSHHSDSWSSGGHCGHDS